MHGTRVSALRGACSDGRAADPARPGVQDLGPRLAQGCIGQLGLFRVGRRSMLGRSGGPLLPPIRVNPWTRWADGEPEGEGYDGSLRTLTGLRLVTRSATTVTKYI